MVPVANFVGMLLLLLRLNSQTSNAGQGGKLSLVYSLVTERSKIFKHLFHDYTEPIRDPLWGHIYLSTELLKIIEDAQFQKLHGIKQLGPAFIVYPGATHTRLDHSLGVFQIAKRMITRFLKYWNLGNISLDAVKGFLCASLLHDLGHYPFAHSIKDLDVASHESLTARRIIDGRLNQVIKKSLGIDPELVAAIIYNGIDYRRDETVFLFRKILSGVLDPDKLDYLNRDAYFCGVPYGIQDVDFILSEIFPHPTKGFAITQKGITAVESILFSRYLMYRTVYRHKTVRIATAMIKKAIFCGLDEGIIKHDDLYYIDDKEFMLLMNKHRCASFELVDRVFKRKLFKAVARVPFRQNSSLHSKLENNRERAVFERDLANELSTSLGRDVTPYEIIVDVPEKISFELDLEIVKMKEQDMSSFRKSGSVFTQAVVDGFKRNIRFITLLSDSKPDILAMLRKMDLNRVLDDYRQPCTV